MAPRKKTAKELDALRDAVIKFLMTEEYKAVEQGQLPWVKSKRGTRFLDWSLHWKPFRKESIQSSSSASAILLRSGNRIVKSTSKKGKAKVSKRSKTELVKPPTPRQDQPTLDPDPTSERTKSSLLPDEVTAPEFDAQSQSGIHSIPENIANNTVIPELPLTETQPVYALTSIEQATEPPSQTTSARNETTPTKPPEAATKELTPLASEESASLSLDTFPGWLYASTYNGPCGLENCSPSGMISAKCFRNATLQCLSHLPTFARYIESVHDADDCECVPCVLRDFIYTYWHHRESLEGIAGTLNRSIQAWCPETNDFWRNANDVGLYGDPREYLDLVVLMSLQEWATRANRIDGFESMFWFEVMRQYQCPQCNNIVSDMNSTSQATITVNVTDDVGSITLDDCLREQFIGQTEPRRCTSEQCRSQQTPSEAPLRDEKVLTTFFTMPSAMFLSINRNYFQNGQNITSDRKVVFGQQLDMSKYAAEGVEAHYALTGVVANSGLDNGSHYIALVRSLGGEGWSLINDEVVYRYDGELDEPRLPDSPGWKFNPVLLMYGKIVDI